MVTQTSSHGNAGGDYSHMSVPAHNVLWTRGARRKLVGSRVGSFEETAKLFEYWKQQRPRELNYRFSFVYIIRAEWPEGTQHKIGVSVHPWKRIAQVVPHWIKSELVFFGYVRNPLALEGGLHMLFRELATDRNEWFELSPYQVQTAAQLIDRWSLVSRYWSKYG